MAFKLKSLFRGRGGDEAVHALYGAIVAQARRPGFYLAAGVPDSGEGRFAMVALHGFLAMDRLGREASAQEFTQALFDVMFADMDRNLREMGVGDLSIGKKVTGLAQYFYAMAAACREGLKEGGDVLEDALRQYVWRGIDPGEDACQALVDYMERCAAGLAGQDAARIVKGEIAFVAAPGEE
jgi:cytochrome b pre-mRNA-processing protein 3